MKKKILAYFSGVFATVLVLTMVTTALAASGKATFNFVNVSLRGERKIAAGADITVANGQKVPSSILYTDEKGGKTNYLPIRADTFFRRAQGATMERKIKRDGIPLYENFSHKS